MRSDMGSTRKVSKRISQKFINSLMIILFSSTAWAGMEEDMNAIIDQSKPAMFTPQEAKWVPAPANLPPGATVFVMEGDPIMPGPFTLQLKLPANYKLPAYWQPMDEHLAVISGAINLGVGDKFDQRKSKLLPAGSFSRIPAKTHHYSWTTEETIVQLHGQGPWGINYLDPNDDPNNIGNTMNSSNVGPIIMDSNEELAETLGISNGAVSPKSPGK